MTISPEEFTKEWQKAKSIADLAKKFKMDPVRVSGRAATYRKKGVMLKKFSSGRGISLDVAALNEIARENGPTGAHMPRSVKKSSKKAK